MRSHPALFLLGLAVVVVGLLLLIGNREFDDEPFGPASTSPDGAMGLVRLLERYGSVDIVTDAPSEQSTAILLDEAPRADLEPLRDWVAAGGTLVVADPRSDLLPEGLRTTGSGSAGLVGRGDCSIARLNRIGQLHVEFAERRFVEARGCFGTDPRVVEVASGAGRLIVVVDQSPFVNAFLAEADNAVFAVDLLVGAPGDSVAFVQTTSVVASGDATLGDLISANVKAGLWFLLGSLVVFALYRSRRLGTPVAEVPLVEIPGSELVRATGNLLERTASTNDAAALIRSSARRDAALRLGHGPDVSPLHLSRIASEASSLDQTELESLFVDSNTSEAQLVQLTDHAERLRRDLRAHASAPLEES